MDQKITTAIDIHLEDGAKFEITDSKIIILNVPLTGEIVQQYADGFAYKPVEEITSIDVQNVPVTFLHPDKSVEDMSTNEVAENTHGFLRNPTFDSKFPDKLYADVVIFRSNDTKFLEDKLEKKEGVDVSIGFQFYKEEKSGTFLGKAYDYIQRNIKLDHLAILIDKIGQVHPGRAPFSKGFGIGADSDKLDNKMDKEFEKLTKDHAVLQNTSDTMKVENEKLVQAASDSEEKIVSLEADSVAKDEKLKVANDKLAVFEKVEKDSVDSMRKELTEKMPSMEGLFKSADVDSIKKAHDEMLKAKAKAIVGDNEDGKKSTDAEDLDEMFGKKKKEEAK